MKTFIHWLEALASYNVGPFSASTLSRSAAKGTAINYFTREDRVALKNQAMARKLEQILSRLSGINFNVIFFEDIEGGGLAFKDYGIKVQRYIRQNNIQTAGHITFVKNSSTGDNMTPWMILHTVGHAIFNEDKNVELKVYAKNMLKSMYESGKPTASAMEIARNIGKHFKFRSALNSVQGKKNFIASLDEFLFELVAEYMWHGGKIRHDPNEPMPVKNAIEGLEEIIKEAIHNCIGRVIYDYYGE